MPDHGEDSNFGNCLRCHNDRGGRAEYAKFEPVGKAGSGEGSGTVGRCP